MHYDQSNQSHPSGSLHSRQASASESPDPNKKRKRVSRACDACFTKKDRCDGGQPICRVCRDLNRRCTYNRPERKRGPLQGVRQRLEGQIEILEGVLGYLVSTFPMIQQDALRMLRLDDGEAFMMDATQRGDVINVDSSASSSRLPAGEIYPSFDKTYAKELWRHSDLAKSIAPSLGLRIGLQDEEDDLMERSIHHQRVEEAKRARARISNMPPQLSRFSIHQQQYQPSHQNPSSAASVPPTHQHHQMGQMIQENLKGTSIPAQSHLVYPFNNNPPIQKSSSNTFSQTIGQSSHQHIHDNDLAHSQQIHSQNMHKSPIAHLLSQNPQHPQHPHHPQQHDHHQQSSDSQSQHFATLQSHSPSDQQANMLPSLHSHSFGVTGISNEPILEENGGNMNLPGGMKSTGRNEHVINTIPEGSIISSNLRMNQQNDIDIGDAAEGDVTQEDPFDAQWTHTSFDLADLGEGAHALAYALGLPSASYGDNNDEHVHNIHPLSAAMDAQMAASDSIAVLQQGFSV